MSATVGSRPRPRASGELVTRFAHRISRGESGNTEFPAASLKARAMSSKITWAILDVRRCRRN